MVLLYLCAFVLWWSLLHPCSFSLVLSESFYLSIAVDSASLFFLSTLCMVRCIVILWSYFYMDIEVRYRNFCTLVFFFLASMIGLVLSGDLLTLFIFWDLLGFSSFFLVVFYRSNSVVGAGFITACTNRLGDCLLFCLIGCTFVYCSEARLLICVILILASMTKSALLPFSSWLTSAMSAPTPVSALVHSSTLVTAGVYLLFRFQAYPAQILNSISLLTLMYAGFCACLERDLKKVVALSTLSHLGIIMFRIRASDRNLAFLHLNYHAYFKSLLFLGVGTLIHATYGSQERRYPLVLSSGSPFLWVGLITPMLSLCGLIFMTGWASKELILESIYNSTSGLCSLGAFYTSIGLSVGYCVRFVYSTLRGASFGPSLRSVGLPVSFSLPVIVLCFGSAVMGKSQCLYQCKLVSFTCSEEKFFLWWFMGIGVFLAYLFLSTSVKTTVNWALVSCPTLRMAGLSTKCNGLSNLEVGSLQACGIGGLLFPLGSILETGSLLTSSYSLGFLVLLVAGFGVI